MSNAIGAVCGPIDAMPADLLLEVAAHPMVPPPGRVAVLSELHGRAFLLRLDGDAAQRAWDECVDEEDMLRAIGEARSIALVLRLQVAVARYTQGLIDRMRRTDHMASPHVISWLSVYADRMAQPRPLLSVIYYSIGVDETVFGSRDAARALLCEEIRMSIPVSPDGFGGLVGVETEDLLARLLRCRLEPPEAKLVEGLRVRFELARTLAKRQRQKAEAILRAHGWQVR